MILRTIRCDVPACGEVFTEENENKGFPGWGHFFGGIFNDETNSETFYLCPDCKKIVFEMLLKGKQSLKVFSVILNKGKIK